MSSTPTSKAPQPLRPCIVAPTVDEWRAMSPEARQRLLEEIIDALSDPQRAMAEGQPHLKAKRRVIDMLGMHFGAIGRVIYLAEEMAVLYPDEPVFVPDILAVVDVPQPEDDQRMAWVVADEGRGLDLVIEVLHHGDRNKDLVENVERYAGLGIPEYFVYDRLHSQIHGFRLASPEAGRYQRIVPQYGRYRSEVLGLDLMIADGKLRFFYGMAELFGSTDLIERLQGLVSSLEEKADRAETEAAQAQARVDQTIALMQQSILSIVEVRGISCAEGDRARVRACTDSVTLQRWLMRAAIAGSMAEVLAEA